MGETDDPIRRFTTAAERYVRIVDGAEDALRLRGVVVDSFDWSSLSHLYASGHGPETDPQ